MDTELIRGWRAHCIEKRWFYVLFGSFELNLIKIDKWEKPDNNLPVEKIVLSAGNKEVIHIPAGYWTAFKALEGGSEILVFSDYLIEHTKEDDYTWDLSYFLNV